MTSVANEVSTVTHSVSEILDHLLARVENLEKEFFHDTGEKVDTSSVNHNPDSNSDGESEKTSAVSSTESADPGVTGIDNVPNAE